MATPFLGQITLFAGNFAPRGWAFCEGQLLPISQNTALFSILGTTYGGNGQTTFALPDLRGRAPIHPGQGPGLSNRFLGEQGGEEATSLSTAQMPAHSHPAGASSAAQTTNRPGGAVPARGGVYATGANTTMGGDTVAGDSQPHNTMQPFTALSYIIALEGIFPSRN